MIGIDIAGVGRMRALLDRFPRATERFFTEEERRHCLGHSDPATRFAGTFAAKEAVVKALRLGPIAAWTKRIEITRDRLGAPSVTVDGAPTDVVLSISHDAGLAIAVAILQERPREPHQKSTKAARGWKKRRSDGD
jgi:holo-[acyl-carrier protein] synthase